MSAVRFAIVGCGRIVRAHLEAIADEPQAKLVAVCDIVPERAQACAQQYGVPAYTDYHAMLQQEQVDVVNILTPSGMHPAHAIDIMRGYHKHVVIEKPMALRLADLDRLKAAAVEAGVGIFPVYQNRYNKAVQKVRSALQAGELGRVVLAAVQVRWCRTQQYYDQDAWRGTWAMDGGALTNQGIHYLDLLQYLVGDVETVTARAATQLVNVQVEDTAVATLRFRSGALGVIEITTAARPVDLSASVSVLAEQGVAVLSGIACNELSSYSPDPEARTAFSEQFSDPYGRGHRRLIEDVVMELLEGRPYPISFDEGTHALQLLHALYWSTETGQAARLEDNPSSARLGEPNLDLARLYEAPSSSRAELA